jgi:hypothetical protein
MEIETLGYLDNFYVYEVASLPLVVTLNPWRTTVLLLTVNNRSTEIHTLINSIWNMEQLPDQWKESIILPIYKGDKTDCSSCRGMSLLSTSYKMLSNILLTSS